MQLTRSRSIMLKKEKQIENSVLIAFLFGSFDSEISFFFLKGKKEVNISHTSQYYKCRNSISNDSNSNKENNF